MQIVGSRSDRRDSSRDRPIVQLEDTVRESMPEHLYGCDARGKVVQGDPGARKQRKGVCRSDVIRRKDCIDRRFRWSRDVVNECSGVVVCKS